MRRLAIALIVALSIMLVVMIGVMVSRQRRRPHIRIVYFAHIRRGVWKKIIKGQMTDLRKSGLLDHVGVSLHVVLTGDDLRDAEDLIARTLHSHDFQLTTSHSNHYEWLGIKTLYDEAHHMSPDTIFLYFHSKGMVYQHRDDHDRTHDEQVIFAKMVAGWETILKKLEDNPDIEKICYGASAEGWCWYNFFWVRGRFLRRCKKPSIHDDNRYYFEEYIGTACFPTSYRDCINIMGEEEQKPLGMWDVVNLLVDDKNKNPLE